MPTEESNGLIDAESPDSPNTDSSRCGVNRKTFQVKLIYFLYLAGTSALRPYFAIYFRHVGLDETEAGIITGIQPFLRFFSEPLWGAIADKLACHKAVLLIVMVLSTLFNASLCSVSLIQNYVGQSGTPKNESIRSLLSPAGLSGSVQGFTPVTPSCFKVSILCDDRYFSAQPLGKGNASGGEAMRRLGVSKKERHAACCCRASCVTLISNSPWTEIKLRASFPDETKNNQSLFFSCEVLHLTHGAELKGDSSRLNKKESVNLTEENDHSKDSNGTAKQCLCDFRLCGNATLIAMGYSLGASEGTKTSGAGIVAHVTGPLSRTDSFYILLGLSCLGQFFSGPILSIMDASTMKLLGSEKEGKFGNQRLWGAIGFGLGGFLSGLVMDESKTFLAGANSAEESSYMSAFVMYAGFSVLLILVCCCFDVSQGEKAHVLFRHLRVLLSKVSVVTFLSVVLAMGISSGVIQAFLFWYLEDLGASQLVIGLSIAVTCISEVVVFRLAGKLIKCLGYAGVLYLSLIAFIARFVGYTFLTDPWYVLPIEVLHGFTYAAMWSVCICYASLIAPPEIATTIQGVVSGVHFGLGWGIGGMAGGVVYQAYGAKVLFISCAGLCGVALVLFTIVQTTVKLHDVTAPHKDGGTRRTPQETDPLVEKHD